MNKLIGIRYIGKKDLCEDSVTNSGAIWLPGQVLNFGAKQAAKLLEHATVWEATEVDPASESFMSEGQAANTVPAPVAVMNFNAMSTAEMGFYAKREFNRVIEVEGRSHADVRADVIRLMTLATLDDLGLQALAVQDKVAWVSMVTLDEYQALTDGTLRLTLTPGKNVETKTEVKEVAAEVVPPTLKELLDSLDKPGLLELAKQEGVKIDGRTGDAQIRSMLAEALKE